MLRQLPLLVCERAPPAIHDVNLSSHLPAPLLELSALPCVRTLPIVEFLYHTRDHDRVMRHLRVAALGPTLSMLRSAALGAVLALHLCVRSWRVSWPVSSSEHLLLSEKMLSMKLVHQRGRERSVVRHCYFRLDHLNVFVFPRFGEMPLWKRKEAKEKGLSEPDSPWS